MSTKIPEKYYSGGFLYNPDTNEVLLHQRDDKTENSPNLWAFFGGTNEKDDSSPIETFCREIKEELSIIVPMVTIQPLCDYFNPDFNIHRFVFYATSCVPKSKMKLHEGAGFDWIPLDQAFSLNITKSTRRDLEIFKKILPLPS